VVIAGHFCNTFDTNVQHWTEHIRWDYGKISKWPLTKKKNLHQVNLCTSQGWQKEFIMHTALFQHRCSKSRELPFTSASACRPITLWNTPASFPMWALNSPKRWLVRLFFNTLQGINNFFQEFQVQCTYVWAVVDPGWAIGAIAP